ncbi:hypothetical protein [Flaviflagellibacter deserti]|uniref:Uncharacterized protein n=1 Tax=Flaviflagellibacter deserti TaxID=2267266 RepID=A0ABV9Z5N8_9HYPH
MTQQITQCMAPAQEAGGWFIAIALGLVVLVLFLEHVIPLWTHQPKRD